MQHDTQCVYIHNESDGHMWPCDNIVRYVFTTSRSVCDDFLEWSACEDHTSYALNAVFDYSVTRHVTVTQV